MTKDEVTNELRAEVLAQALPYIRMHSGQVVVVKYGGNAMIDEQLKQDRYDILMRHQLSVSEEIGNSLIGKTLRVLVEDFDPVSEAFVGRSYRDAPDVDGKVFFTSPKGEKFDAGDFVDVLITESMDYDLVGEAL